MVAHNTKDTFTNAVRWLERLLAAGVSTHFIPAYSCGPDSGFPQQTPLAARTLFPSTLPFLPLLPRVPVSRRRESFCGLGRSFGRGGNKKQSSQRGVDRRWHHHRHHRRHPAQISFILARGQSAWPPRKGTKARMQSGTLLRFFFEKPVKGTNTPWRDDFAFESSCEKCHWSNFDILDK